MTDVLLVDYGAGNLRSLRAAFARIRADARVTADADEAAGARRLVLPGVGAAAPAMQALRVRGLDGAVTAALERGGRLLGICLGLQLLFERSAEGDAACLGLLPGRSEEMAWARRLPHMGWNDVEPARDHPITAGLPAVCYFAHSYAVAPAEAGVVAATTELDGRRFASVVANGRVAGAQFHPEKSGAAGRALLQAFLAWDEDAP